MREGTLTILLLLALGLTLAIAAIVEWITDRSAKLDAILKELRKDK